jgi:hypothetical protein
MAPLLAAPIPTLLNVTLKKVLQKCPLNIPEFVKDYGSGEDDIFAFPHNSPECIEPAPCFQTVMSVMDV